MTNLTRGNLFDVAYDATVRAIKQPNFSKTTPWPGLVQQLRVLMGSTGFDEYGEVSLDSLRKAVGDLQKAGGNEGSVLATGAGVPAGGAPNEAAIQRCAALKTLRHTYFQRKRGGQKIWIVALPKSFDTWSDRYLDCGPADLLARLNAGDEQFDSNERKHVADAAQTALKWAHKAQIVLDDVGPTSQGLALLKRWFADESTTDDELKVFAATLNAGLKKIAFKLSSGTLTVTDFVPIRHSSHAKDIDTRASNAFIVPGGQDVIYVEPPFFTRPGKAVFLSDARHWARIMVHEMSHREARTLDNRYAYKGIRPRAGTFAHAAACTNADSWAIFVADAAGAMSDNERSRALNGT